MRFRITSEEQREKVIKKLANMMIDHITEEAEDKARGCVKDLFDFNMDSDDVLQVDYAIKFNAAILKLLLGSVKRENAKKENKKKQTKKEQITKDVI